MTFCLANQGRLEKFATKNGAGANVDTRPEAIENLR
jgi:hypothetical protein